MKRDYREAGSSPARTTSSASFLLHHHPALLGLPFSLQAMLPSNTPADLSYTPVGESWGRLH